MSREINRGTVHKHSSLKKQDFSPLKTISNHTVCDVKTLCTAATIMTTDINVKQNQNKKVIATVILL